MTVYKWSIFQSFKAAGFRYIEIFADLCCYAFTLSVSCANLFLRLDPLCVLPDRYLRLPDLVEHGCCWVIPNNDYVLVGATSLTFLIYPDLLTYVSLRPL